MKNIFKNVEIFEVAKTYKALQVIGGNAWHKCGNRVYMPTEKGKVWFDCDENCFKAKEIEKAELNAMATEFRSKIENITATVNLVDIFKAFNCEFEEKENGLVNFKLNDYAVEFLEFDLTSFPLVEEEVIEEGASDWVSVNVLENKVVSAIAVNYGVEEELKVLFEGLLEEIPVVEVEETEETEVLAVCPICGKEMKEENEEGFEVAYYCRYAA